MDLQPGEYISHLTIDSTDRSSGTPFNFIVPRNSLSINMTGIDRLAVDSYNFSDVIYDINAYTRTFQVANAVGTLFTVTLTDGYYSFTTGGINPAFDAHLQARLTADAAAVGVWTVTWSQGTNTYTISCTNTFRIIVPNFADAVLQTIGLETRPTLATSYVTQKASLIYSPVMYICSNRLTRFNARDVHTNPEIPNILCEIGYKDTVGAVSSFTMSTQFQTLKIQNWDETEPIGIVDIYIVDKFGRNLPYDPLRQASYYLQLKLKCARKYSEPPSKIKSFKS